MPRLDPSDPRLAAPDFPHGTPKGYRLGCSCRSCRRANADEHAEQKARRTGRPRGQIQGSRIDATDVKAHVCDLIKRGDSVVSFAAIAAAAGVADAVVANLVSGRKDRATEATTQRLLAVTLDDALAHAERAPAAPVIAKIKALLADECGTFASIGSAAGMDPANIAAIYNGERQYLQQTTAAAIAVLTPERVRRAAGMLPSRRARQRIRALQANAWPTSVLVTRLGYQNRTALGSWLRNPHRQITQETDRKVEALYCAIGDQRGPSERTARWAQQNGHFPPIHYDDDMRLIPESIPGKPTAVDSERHRNWLRVVGLTLRGRTALEIAKTLGITGADPTRIIVRTRELVGLRLNTSPDASPGQRVLTGQTALIKAIEDHTCGIAVLESNEVLDDPDLDYEARWRSLVDTADLLRGAGEAGYPVADWPEPASVAAAAA